MFFDSKYFDDRKFVIGVDEVGRGPLAGPVNACCLMIEKHDDVNTLLEFLTNLGVTDSKKLSNKKRLAILSKLDLDIPLIDADKVYEIKTNYKSKISFIVTELSPTDIDKINILNASLLCMKNGLTSISEGSQVCALIDGNKIPDGLSTNIDAFAIIKGDSKSTLIGLASIIAKEFRDLLMFNFSEVYPGYGLEKHAGYPTKAHKAAIVDLGITPIHRKTFKGVKEYV